MEAAATAIDRANQRAVKIILAGKPFLVGMAKALDVVPGMRKNLILHAGPPDRLGAHVRPHARRRHRRSAL